MVLREDTMGGLTCCKCKKSLLINLQKKTKVSRVEDELHYNNKIFIIVLTLFFNVLASWIMQVKTNFVQLAVNHCIIVRTGTIPKYFAVMQCAIHATRRSWINACWLKTRSIISSLYINITYYYTFIRIHILMMVSDGNKGWWWTMDSQRKVIVWLE